MDDVLGLKVPGGAQDPAALETAPLATVISNPPAAAEAPARAQPEPAAGPDMPDLQTDQPDPQADLPDLPAPAAGPDMPDLQTDLPVTPSTESAGIWENVSAAWTEDTITRDRRLPK
jgi:hypothetical protein